MFNPFKERQTDNMPLMNPDNDNSSDAEPPNNAANWGRRRRSSSSPNQRQANGRDSPPIARPPANDGNNSQTSPPPERRSIASRIGGNRPRPQPKSGQKSRAPVCFVGGPPPPLGLIPPPTTWPLISAIPAEGGRIMAKNINGTGKFHPLNLQTFVNMDILKLKRRGFGG